jgi:hypothetical protein
MRPGFWHLAYSAGIKDRRQINNNNNNNNNNSTPTLSADLLSCALQFALRERTQEAPDLLEAEVLLLRTARTQ